MNVFESIHPNLEENMFDELYVDMDKFQETLKHDTENFLPPAVPKVDESELQEIRDYMKNDGSVYNGQMKKKDNSKFTFISHGKGTQNFKDGSHYEGDWRNGLCEG